MAKTKRAQGKGGAVKNKEKPPLGRVLVKLQNVYALEGVAITGVGKKGGQTPRGGGEGMRK